MSAKKKQGSSKRILIIVIVVAAILAASYGAIYFSSQGNHLPTPSPTSFVASEWMSFVPADASAFRFLNLTALDQFPNLFGNPVLISLSQPYINITVYDVNYGLDMLTANDTLVSVIGLNSTNLDNVSRALEGSSLSTISYNNITFYRLPIDPATGQGSAWICATDGVLILAGGNETAVSGIKSVINAASNSFFNNDSMKIGYLLASSGKNNLVFSYLFEGDNNMSVAWDMRSVTNGTQLNVRETFHFTTVDALNNNYGEFKKDFLTLASAVYINENNLIGDFTYSQSDIRAVVMSE